MKPKRKDGIVRDKIKNLESPERPLQRFDNINIAYFPLLSRGNLISIRPGGSLRAGQNPPAGTGFAKPMGKLEDKRGVIEVVVMLKVGGRENAN